MEIVYLSNGQECRLIEKIGDKYIVNKIFQYQDEDGLWQEIDDNNDVVVDEIFASKPIEKISSEITELQFKAMEERTIISELEKQKRTLKHEIEIITKTQISNSKFIINRSELLAAKTLALFIKDRIYPIILDKNDSNFRGLKLSLTIEISTGEERSWGYKLYNDYSGFGGDYLCEKYGILINPTEEEIIATSKKRLLEFQFSDYWIMQTKDKYLTDEFIEQKNILLKKERDAEKSKLELLLKTTQEKLASIN